MVFGAVSGAWSLLVANEMYGALHVNATHTHTHTHTSIEPQVARRVRSLMTSMIYE